MGNNVTKDCVSAELEYLKKDLDQDSIPKVAAEYQKHLKEMYNMPLNIAVTGNAGAGKSSFVNAIRGVNDDIDDDDDDNSAKVGVIEQTMEPKAYPHPSFPNIKIWDLPGIGTLEFQAKEYLKKVNFEIYDFFIIVASDRFSENDALLAKEIQKMNKKFYYVRSKIDVDIRSEKRKKNFTLEKSLETIRNYCEDCLKRAGEPSARLPVYLISNWKVQKYDFPLLQERIITELPEHKKHILTEALYIFSEKELMMKKELMKSYIKKVAWISCACGAVPVPGLSIACDVGILIDALSRFYRVFGLDDRSLHFLALQTGKKFEELKSAIKKTPLAKTIDANFVSSLLLKSSFWCSLTAVELALDFIPVLGSLFGGASSYIVTYRFLNSFLDDAVEDTRNVRAKFLK